jgi:excisionase family DNA binding protein
MNRFSDVSGVDTWWCNLRGTKRAPKTNGKFAQVQRAGLEGSEFRSTPLNPGLASLRSDHERPVNAKEAAAFLGVCAKTAQNWAREGRIPAHPAGNSFRNRWLFFISELDAWLRAQVISNGHPCRLHERETA